MFGKKRPEPPEIYLREPVGSGYYEGQLAVLRRGSDYRVQSQSSSGSLQWEVGYDEVMTLLMDMKARLEVTS